VDVAYDPRTFKTNAARLHGLAPDAAAAFGELHGAVFRDGALSTSVKELMALAVSVVSGCEDCCGYHLERARRAGATDEEVGEALGVAVVMGGGPAYTYAAETAASLGDTGGAS
jgi:AhpD family alkylhydroperoxidase